MEALVSTTLPVPVVVPPHVDSILDEVGKQLQITPTQFERAESAYRTVGTWLEAEGTSLAPYHPEIYPQGSMALRTTVKPMRGEEFDVDLVCEVHDWSDSAMALHAALGARLSENADYARKLEPKNRCWRLNYANSFHLDALPGREDVLRDGNAIEVPDRKKREWTKTASIPRRRPLTLPATSRR
jgi:hypothetical protein